MKGIRFYQEFDSKSKTRPTGNCLAVLAGNITDAPGNGIFFSGKTACYEAIAGLFDHADSAVAVTSVAVDYLREKCKRVPEAKARKIHPALFERLDRDNEREAA